jgi:hypothetical protein
MNNQLTNDAGVYETDLSSRAVATTDDDGQRTVPSSWSSSFVSGTTRGVSTVYEYDHEIIIPLLESFL